MDFDKALVLFSGGIDSAACAHLLLNRCQFVNPLFVDYGQASSVMERKAAQRLSNKLDIHLNVINAHGISPFSRGELIGRNAFLIMSAIFLAKWHDGLLAIGIHSGTPYFDCSHPFFCAMEKLVAEHTDGAVRLIAPFLKWEKGDIFKYFKTTGLSIEDTYSCESGDESACGQCYSCLDRKALGC